MFSIGQSLSRHCTRLSALCMIRSAGALTALINTCFVSSPNINLIYDFGRRQLSLIDKLFAITKQIIMRISRVV